MPSMPSGQLEIAVVDAGVYPPQHDSRLLIEALQKTNLVPGRNVLDLCTGSGIVAVAAARLGASRVTAFDICLRAVRCSRANAAFAGVRVDTNIGSITDAVASGPFDVVVSNPPYVPTDPGSDNGGIPFDAGPALSQTKARGTAPSLLINSHHPAKRSSARRDGNSMASSQRFDFVYDRTA